MKRTARVFRLLVFCLSAISVTAKAQDYLFATGNPTFSVNIPVENGYINVANGSLHLEFPLANHKQRGALALNERLVYDSRIWMIGHYSNYYWWPTGVPNVPYTQGGWRFVAGNETGTLSTNITLTQPVGCSHIAGSSQYGSESFTWVDFDGTSHAFGMLWGYQPKRCSNVDPPPAVQTSYGWALDGSGYEMLLSGKDNLQASSVQVVDKNGNQVYPQIKDRYGNYWSSDANGNLIDDVGRTPVITTVNGNVTYYDVLSPNGPINNNGTRVRYTVTVAPITVSTQFNQQAVTEWPDSTSGTLSPIQSIQLPDGSSYTFTYDSYGELASMTLPTGGVIHYGWTTYFDSYQNANRWISSRAVGNDPATTFTPQVLSQCASNGTGCQEQVTVHKPSGDETVYQLTLNNGAWNTNTTAYNGAASSGNMAMSVATTYDFSHPCDPSVCVGAQYIQKSISTTTLNNGLKSQAQYVYNNPQLGKPTSLKNWDYFSGSPSSAPNVETDYVYTSFDLTKATTFDNGTQAKQTTYNFTSSATPTSGVPQHTTASGPYLQSVSQWLNTNGALLTTSYTMDDTGSVVQVTDAKSNPPTPVTYQCGNSLPYQVTNGLGHVTTYGYDCNSGAITSVKDPNDLAAGRAGTTYQYESGAGRLQSINYPDGGQTSYSYPSTKEVDTAILANPNPSINSQDIVDDFGRPYQHIQAGSSTETSYDANGRVSCVTNLHYSTASSTDGSTCTSSYDGLDRPLTQTQPDNNTLTWSYPGNTVVSTDEANHSWQRTSDAFGRLTKVIEPNNAETDYSYNLFTTAVSQKGVSGETPRPDRTFTTDSLGRTISVNAPESGITSYAYDNNGNLTSKTDNRGTQTTYTYDALNRLTDKTYNDGWTPGQHYRYEQTSLWAGPQYNTIGRLSQAVTDPDRRYFGGGSAPACNPQSSATANYNPSYGDPTYCNWTDELYSYDAMGRLIRIGTAFPSEAGWAAHGTSIGYDLAGNMTSLTYPDGRVVTQGFDGSGHLQNVTYDNWNGQHVGYLYAGGFTYTPAGAQTEVNYGNGVYIHMPYNNRQQMCQVWSSGTNSQVLIDTHIYYGGSTNFCGSTPQNNGNITQVKDWRNQDRTRLFGYDSLNRLSSYSTGGASQTYSIDSFGNVAQSGTLSSPSLFKTNNQINDGSYAYDAAGNLNSINISNDPLGPSTYSFDAESKVFTMNRGGYYTYDANSNRMRKDADGAYTEYQYLNGMPIAERHSDGTWSDYIYANGQRIARADSFDGRLHLSGVNCDFSQCSAHNSGVYLPYGSGYVVQNGDVLHLRQYQGGSVQGGLMIGFTDGSITNWSTPDTDGQQLNNDGYKNTWHNRTVDMSAHAGKTISSIILLDEVSSAGGPFDLYMSDISITSTNGNVLSIYNRQQGLSLQTALVNGVTNLSGYSEASNQTGDSIQGYTTTTFFTPDQIGSTRMVTVGGGWPVSSSTFYPFGQEPSANSDTNHYRFAELERDSESGLDHATFRQYSSAQGRWMSPDPYLGSYDFSNPQSFNRYAYVGNSPLIATDPSGLFPGCGVATAVGVIATGGPVGPVATGVMCGISIAASVAQDIFKLIGLFGGPSFKGSLHPRPTVPEGTGQPDWNGPIWNEHIGLPAGGQLPGGGLGDIFGIPSSGCEFGACGVGPSGYQAQAIPEAIPPIMTGIAAISACVSNPACRIAMQMATKALADAVGDTIKDLSDTNDLNRCTEVKQRAINECSALLNTSSYPPSVKRPRRIPTGTDNSGAFFACIRQKMVEAGCPNY